MHKMMPLLTPSDFPAVQRGQLDTLQINLGYKCNQACLHCHVNASPKRKEMMDRETIDIVLRFLKASGAKTIDLTGGAPELNLHFRYLAASARELGVNVIDRCNLTILEEPGQEDLAAFLAEHRVEVTASLPCYQESNVNGQRGDGVFEASIRGLKQLNALGYGKPKSGLSLSLVYNPVGPYLPPDQVQLEADYKTELQERYGIVFNNLLTITNMPIARFGSTLVSKGQFKDYMTLLRDAYKPENLDAVMCRNLISVDYQGYVYDCDFNQMLGINLKNGVPRPHLNDLMNLDMKGQPVMVADHCYGCTAGQGSSCGGALA